MDKKRLFVDMDGTLARFHDQVNYLERMFEKDFFRDLEPFENMVAGIRQFISEHPDVEVYILSAKVNGEPPYCEAEKHAWLDMHLPEIPAERRIFTEMGRPKAEYIPGGLTKNDFLLDDYNKGLNQFLFDGGSVIKCHNNINQKGLGAYGGQQGNLWVGKMAHVDDKPELIAAELAGHMGLEYDLARVVAAFPEITLGKAGVSKKRLVLREDGGYDAEEFFNGGKFTVRVDNPLNGLRYLAGKEEFEEIHLRGSGQELRLPAFQLQAVCLNLYGDADYKRFRRADRSQLTSDAAAALQNAEKPIVGQIEYLSSSGRVVYAENFYSFGEMQKEILDSQECGRPIGIRWNIQPPAKSIHEMDYFELETLFESVSDRDKDRAGDYAAAFLEPASRRSRAETSELAAFWEENKDRLGLPLQSFLKMSDAEFSAFQAGGKKTALDDLIKGAEGTKAGRPADASKKDPQR